MRFPHTVQRAVSKQIPFLNRQLIFAIDTAFLWKQCSYKGVFPDAPRQPSIEAEYVPSGFG